MRAILALYMTSVLGFSDGQASRIMAFFIAGCYLLPLAGGWVADNLLGKYWTIVGFSLPYILGHVILGIEQTPFLFLALVLLAMGSGVIKPNISTLMGLTYDQQRPGREQLRSDAFAMFYGAVNIGAAISSFAMPWIRDRFDYQIAFLFPAGLMVLAFAFFAAGKPFYATEVIVRRHKSPQERREQWQVLSRLFGIFIVVAFFWTIFDQAPSTWTFFARDHLDRRIFNFSFLPSSLRDYTLAPDQLQALNPVLIILLLPLVTLTWHGLAKLGLPLLATSKMMIGFILTGICMGIMSVAGFLAGDGTVWVWWEVVAYVLITVAEICISVVGLELSFSAAPKAMKSFVAACWLLAVFVGNMINVLVTPYYETVNPGTYFGLMTLIMVPVTLAFALVARWFNAGTPQVVAPEPKAEPLAETTPV
jgi:POT family proton-dependent oligopeptide transporter